jgi:quercetin dioxygenase-like cupin family protein
MKRSLKEAIVFGINSANGYQEIVDGIRIKTINHGQNMIMTEFLLTKGAILPEHSHIYEQTGYLIKGNIKLTLNNKTRELKTGDSWNIPGGVMHNADIIEDSIAIEIFNPLREDYLKYVFKEDIK